MMEHYERLHTKVSGAS